METCNVDYVPIYGVWVLVAEPEPASAMGGNGVEI
jgi:hypothetical protein